MSMKMYIRKIRCQIIWTTSTWDGMEGIFCSDCCFEWERAISVEPNLEESWKMDQYQEDEWDLRIVIEIKLEIEQWRDRYWRCVLYSRLAITFDLSLSDVVVDINIYGKVIICYVEVIPNLENGIFLHFNISFDT